MKVIQNDSMATLQLNTVDYGKYALFEPKVGDGKIKPLFQSFDLNEVISEAKKLQQKNREKIFAIEQVKDPHICWNYWNV